MKPRSKKAPARRLDPATVHLLKQLGWGLLTVTVCVLIIAAIWHVTRLSMFTIDTVTATGGITIAESEVIGRASGVLDGAYLKLVPRRFTYMYPEADVQRVVSEIPKIKDVMVERTGRNTLTITYDEFVPDSLWCGARDTTDCLFLDESGYAFGEAPDLKGGSFIRYYTPLVSIAIGQTPFTIEDYQVTKDFIEKLGETGWYVSAVEIDSVRDVFYTLVGGGELKVTLNASLDETLNNLNTIRTSDEFAHLTPGTFEYIDLRFGTKVFVNEVREEFAPASGTTTATSTEEGLVE